jgi:hypothetical protein
VKIFDERGELIRTLCGINQFKDPQPVSMSLSNFVHNPGGPGGTLSILVNGSVIAAWDVRDKDGKIVPNSFYHINLVLNFSDGTQLIFTQDIFLTPNINGSAIQLVAGPNIAAQGTIVRISASYGGIPADSRSKIKIYTLDGEMVKALSITNGLTLWDLTNSTNSGVASGLYLAVLDGVDVNTGNLVRKTIKIIVLK